MKKVVLEYSCDVLFNDFWDTNESVLIPLLNEAYTKQLTKGIRIRVTREHNVSTNDYPQLKDQKLHFSYSALNKLYKKFFWGNYSPEFEEKRQQDIADFQETLECYRTGARNGIYELIAKMELGLIC